MRSRHTRARDAPQQCSKGRDGCWIRALRAQVGHICLRLSSWQHAWQPGLWPPYLGAPTLGLGTQWLCSLVHTLEGRQSTQWLSSLAPLCTPWEGRRSMQWPRAHAIPLLGMQAGRQVHAISQAGMLQISEVWDTLLTQPLGHRRSVALPPESFGHQALYQCLSCIAQTTHPSCPPQGVFRNSQSPNTKHMAGTPRQPGLRSAWAALSQRARHTPAPCKKLLCTYALMESSAADMASTVPSSSCTARVSLPPAVRAADTKSCVPGACCSTSAQFKPRPPPFSAQKTRRVGCRARHAAVAAPSAAPPLPVAERRECHQR